MHCGVQFVHKRDMLPANQSGGIVKGVVCRRLRTTFPGLASTEPETASKQKVPDLLLTQK